MAQYILRRLIIMIPTLLGVSLVTLLLIHLAPGDPVQVQLDATMGKGTISPEEIEAMRRTFYLHLPVFLNTSPEDADAYNADLEKKLLQQDENKREQAVRRLVIRGMAGLSSALDAISQGSPEAKFSILAGLEQIAMRAGLTDELKSAPEASAWWQTLSSQLPKRNAPEITELVAKYVASPSDETRAAVKKFDTLALPALFVALQTLNPSSPSLSDVTIVLHGITGVDYEVRPSDSADARENALDNWVRWWKPRKAEHADFTGLSRLYTLITETQYAKWVGRLITFDFDRSSRDNIPIRNKLGDRLSVTLTLSLLSLMVSYLIAIPLGVFSAVKQYSFIDRVSTLVLFMLYSLPSFWVAMLAQQYLCGADPHGLDLFPLVGIVSSDFDQMTASAKIKDLVWHLILPVAVLTYRSFASLSRFQRVGMLEVIRQDYIRTARAKGLPERVVILKHALRNSVLPIVTLIGLQLPFLVGGAVIVEAIFQINGMGLETLEAIRTRDLNWIMASVTLTAIMTMAGILLSDILYALIDPRIQVGSESQAA